MNLKIISVFILTGLFAVSCVDFPEETVLPVWNTEISFPIIEETYTLLEAVEKDSSNLRWNVSEDEPNLLYFVDNSHKLDTIEMADNLTLEDFAEEISDNVNSIRINQVVPVQADISTEEATGGFSPGQEVALPPAEINISAGFKRIKEYKNLTLEKGILTLTVGNNLPAEIELQGISILNAGDRSVIINDVRTHKIDSENEISLAYDLNGIELTDTLLYEGVVKELGSGGEVVKLPESPAVYFRAALDSLEIQRALAPLPEQEPFEEKGEVVFEDSTYLKKATLKSGNLQFTFINNFDVNLTADLKMLNLRDQNGNIFTKKVYLQRFEELIYPVNPIDLKGWVIESLNPGELTNALEYSITVNTEAAEDLREISKTDSINVLVNGFDLKLKEFEGRFKPKTFTFDVTSFELDLGDLDSTFSYEKINFNNPNISLRLLSSANIDYSLNGAMKGVSQSTSRSIELDDIYVPPQGQEVIVDLEEYGFKEMMNSFEGGLPDSFQISGKTKLNPYYQDGSVTSQDYIAGNIEIEVPLNIGISGGMIIDTIDIDFGDVDTADIKRVNYGIITIELTNKIPASVKLTGEVVDSLGTPLLSFPPRPVAPSNEYFIQVLPPKVDSDGNVTEASVLKQEIELLGSEVTTFVNNKRMAIQIMLETPPAGSDDPVKFKTTDEIKIKAYGKASYRFDHSLED